MSQSTLVKRACPQDIFDLVIDELQSDAQSLRACSLVSQAWLHASRRHLFRSVTISVGNADDPKDIRKFNEVLTSPIPRALSYYIRSLAIEGYATAASGRLSRPRAYLPLDAKDLLLLLDHLPNLNILTLDHAKFYSTALETKHLGSCSSLESFRFRTTLQEGPYDYKALFMHLLPRFTSVTDLDLALHCSPSMDVYPMVLPDRLSVQKIKSFRLEASAAQGPVLKSLLNVVSFAELRNLEVAGTTSALVSPLGQIINAAASSLHNFSFQIFDVATSAWSNLNLSECTSLRSISIAVPLCYSAQANQARWAATIDILATLPCSLHMVIQIIFTIDSHDPLDTVDAFHPSFGHLHWTPARKIISKMKNLRQLEVVITVPVRPFVADISGEVLKVCRKSLEQGFPELRQKGRLVIDYWPAPNFSPEDSQLYLEHQVPAGNRSITV